MTNVTVGISLALLETCQALGGSVLKKKNNIHLLIFKILP